MVFLSHFSVNIFYICVFLFAQSKATEYVPVFMWEYADSNALVPAVGRVNQATFQEVILERIKNSNPTIVVFAEPNLSPEDFTVQNSKTFQNLLRLGERTNPSYIPLVETPIEVFKQLPSQSTEISIADLNVEKLPESKLLIIKLNDAKDNENRLDMLKRHDALIYKIYKKLTEGSDHVLGVFTGEQSSWVVPTTFKRQARAATEAETGPSTGKSVTSDNFLAYVSDKIQIIQDGVVKEVALLEMKNDQEKHVTLTLEENETIVFDYTHEESGYWTLSNPVYNNGSGETKFMGSVYAPVRFSYHCTNMSYSVEKTTIILPSFQIQYFDEMPTPNLKFDDAYDCVGFTTAPIWSGIFVTIILVLIMTAGLTMMMDIKTMDRFDDPKGKTIIINASE